MIPGIVPAPSLSAQTLPSRLALVIGNSAFTSLPPIPGCVASAHVVTAALQRAGFTVTEKLNESNGRMGAALADFSDALAAAPNGSAVLYACGYAVGFDARVFLLPVSATLERPTDALTQGLLGRLPVNTVVRSKAKAGLVVLDTVATPGSNVDIPLASLIDEKAMDDTGFIAIRAASAPPQGASTMAAALSAALSEPRVEIKATIGKLRNAFASPTTVGLAAYEPTEPAYLVGGEPPPAAAIVPVQPAVVAPAEPVVPNTAERRRAQLSLQRLGYFHGKVDGVFGPDTIAALRRYQTENGIAPTGKLTADQLASLLENGR